MVHAHGVARVINGREWPHPRTTDDVPADYINPLFDAIVEIEIAIERVDDKRELSQNRDAADIEGVVAGLTLTGEAEPGMAELLSKAAAAKRAEQG